MHLWHTGSVFHHKPSPASCRALHRYPRCGSTSLRLIGALSLTAAAVSGLELPAWPDRHGWSSHRCAHGSQVAEPSCSVLLTECLHERDRPAQRSVLLVRTNPPGQGIINFCQCARLCAHDRNSGNRTRGGSVYDERPNPVCYKCIRSPLGPVVRCTADTGGALTRGGPRAPNSWESGSVCPSQ